MGIEHTQTKANNPIHFHHRGAARAVAAEHAGRSVLNYLRRDCQLTGTKEGCAEGDCGACCVIAVSQNAEGLIFESVNACIMPLANLHGKILLSVEDLARQGTPHPVQAAMVAAHASQCGFCTPGFVASLAACHEQGRCAGKMPTREAVLGAISGNLCRCTGYRPIVEAGVQAGLDATGLDHASLSAALLALPQANPQAQTLQDNSPTILTPRSLTELTQAVAAHPSATLCAGLSDVGLWLNKQLRDIALMISASQVPELHVLNADSQGMQGITIGAAVTLTQAQPLLLAHYPELHEWYERFASRPIRNAATFGGNVVGGSPIGDSMPVLLALNASLNLHSAAGSRSLALNDFYLGYQKKDLRAGEVLVSIHIPPRPAGLMLAVYKVSKRFEDDISAVCAAFALNVENGNITQARAGFGGVAATPIRALSLEAALAGQPFTAATLNAIAPQLETAFTPLSDHRASAAYRRTICGNLLRRAAEQWFGNEPTRVFSAVEHAA